MKTFLALLTLGLAFSAYAQVNNTIDDLSTISLNLDAPATEAHDIHYPNYRIGGGNGPGRELRDCLLLDVRHSDALVTLDQKLKLAKELKVLEGFLLSNEEGGRELELVIKENNIVFLMTPLTYYVTWLRVSSRDERNLNVVLEANLPPIRPGNSLTPPTGLVYVRDCRF